MKRLLLAALAAALPGFATAAAATPALATTEPDHLTNGCAPFAMVLRLAMAQYGEAPAFVATAGTAIVIAFTVNAKTGTWDDVGSARGGHDVPRHRWGGLAGGAGCGQADRAGRAAIVISAPAAARALYCRGPGCDPITGQMGVFAGPRA